MRRIEKPFKIGLSDLDKTKMANDISERVKVVLNYGSPSGVYTTSEILGFEVNKGILVSSDDDYWYYWDTKLVQPNKYVKGELFNETANVGELRQDVEGLKAKDILLDGDISRLNNKRDNETIYSTKDTEFLNAMKLISDDKTFYNYFYNLRKSTSNNWLVQLDNLDNIKMALNMPTFSGKGALSITRETTEAGGYFLHLLLTNDNHSALYANTIGGWLTGSKLGVWRDLLKPSSMDAVDLEQMIDNPYPNEITKDLNHDATKVEIHLDRSFVASLDQEYTLAVARPNSNKQQWTLGGEEVARLKGLRVWIKFAYNGNELVLSHDIRFPTNRSGYQWYVSTPIPNPAIFSANILVQYNNRTDELSLKSSGGSISADTQIIEIKGIK